MAALEAAIQGPPEQTFGMFGPGWPGVDAKHRSAMTPAMEWWVVSPKS